MAVELDRGRLAARMKELGLGISDLALLAGVSRQTVHALLRPNYRPLGAGLEAIARILGIGAHELLRETPNMLEDWQDVGELARTAMAGNSRAFELLPAALASARIGRVTGGLLAEPVLVRVLLAAVEVARMLRPSGRLDSLEARLTRANAGSGEWHSHAILFGLPWMSPERIVSATPDPMRRHGVFGAFEMGDFERHFR